MTVRVGELDSRIEFAGDGAAGGTGSGAGHESRERLQPSWSDRERHRRLADADRCDRERVAGEGFGG